MKRRTEENGTKNNNWETPQYIYDYIEEEFFDSEYFDPCPLNASFDGLEIDWQEANYINPPYSPSKLKEAFIKKACEQYERHNALCVMLIPASTETKIFHDVIVPNAKVILIKKRVRFKGHNTNGEYVTDKTGQSGSMFVVFGEDYEPEITTVDLNERTTVTADSISQQTVYSDYGGLFK